MKIKVDIPLVQDFRRFLYEGGRLSENTCNAYASDVSSLTSFFRGKFDIETTIEMEMKAWKHLRDKNTSGDGCLETKGVSTTVTGAVVGAKVETLKNFLDYLEHLEYRPTTVNRKVASLRVLYKWLLGLGFIERHPMESTRYPNKNLGLNTDFRVDLSREFIDTLLENIDDKDLFGARDRAIICLYRFMGLMPKDVVRIKHSDLNLRDRTVVLGLRRKRNPVSIPDSVWPSVESYLNLLHQSAELFNYSSSDTIFFNKFGRPISTRSLCRNLKNYIRSVGLERITNSRLLRRCFIVEKIVNGVPIQDVQMMAGHINICTTRMYERLIQDMTAA